jgi:myo-inositol 2-dehydrogenase/D-chiro-inositol 1-dehydrogenase
MIRLGVAGLGGMGTVHAANAQSSAGAKLVAVASTRPDRAAELASQLAVEPRSYEELIAADDIDAVVVAARSIDHAAVALDVLRAGKHLFLEKPGATSLASHDELTSEAARQPDAVIQVGYHRRYDGLFVEAARLVAGGAIGEPLLVVGTSRDIRTTEPEDPGPAGGFLLDMASHDYDAACWFLGQEPVEVHAARQAVVYPELSELGDLDNALVTIRFDRGGLASTHVSRTCVFGHDIRMEVVGTEGSVLIGNGASHEGVVMLRADDRAAFPEDYRERFADAYCAELAAFVAACAGDGPAGPGLTEDRRAVAIGVAARAAAVAGAPLEVGQDWPWP